MTYLTPEELGNMEIDCPPMSEQLEFTYVHCTKDGISQLEHSISAEIIPNDIGIKEEYEWFLERRRWVSPPAKAITAYFDHFIHHYPDYEDQDRFASLLDVSSNEIDAYKHGADSIPYNVWYQFLVVTGRKHQKYLM
jgi:hypothetical protein